MNCSARAAGVAASCWTTNAVLIEAARSITEFSYIYVGYDSAGYCTYLGVYNFSYNSPLIP